MEKKTLDIQDVEVGQVSRVIRNKSLQERLEELAGEKFVLHLIGKPVHVNSENDEQDGRKEYQQSYLHISPDGQSVLDKKVSIIVLDEGKRTERAYWKIGTEPRNEESSPNN